MYQALCSIILSVLMTNLWSMTLILPVEGDLVGEIQYSRPEIGETLSDVGLRYDIGYEEMVRANSKVAPGRLLPLETRLIIPSQFILPPGPRVGLVINLAEYRLYYYPPNDNVVITMPIGIGREGWTTPLGLTKVTHKERDPIWRPTANVQAEAVKNGRPIPNAFPPGEGNPLGRHIFRLGWPTFLIHGTNRRSGVGARVSAGCIRMLPEDIEYLYTLVAVGTPVRVVNEPLKFGRQNGSLYMQAHLPLQEQKSKNLNERAKEQLAKLAEVKMNFKQVELELSSPSGLPKKLN